MKNRTNGPEMVVIPAGRFRMGDTRGIGGNDKQPVHEVRISRRFGVSRHEITFDLVREIE